MKRGYQSFEASRGPTIISEITYDGTASLAGLRLAVLAVGTAWTNRIISPTTEQKWPTNDQEDGSSA